MVYYPIHANKLLGTLGEFRLLFAKAIQKTLITKSGPSSSGEKADKVPAAPGTGPKKKSTLSGLGRALGFRLGRALRWAWGFALGSALGWAGLGFLGWAGQGFASKGLRLRRL